MGSTEIDERLSSLYRRIRTLTRTEFDALARAGHRPRGPIERICGFVGLDGRYRLLRGDPLEQARSDARAAFKRQRRQPPNLSRPWRKGLAAAWVAWFVGALVARLVLTTPYDGPDIQLSQMAGTVAFGAAFLAAAAMEEVMRRRSLTNVADPLGPIFHRTVRTIGLGVAIWAFLLALGTTQVDGKRVLPREVFAPVFVVLTLGGFVWLRRGRPWPPGALRPLRDVELAVATETIDPSVDTRLLRVAWESGVGPLDG